MAKLVFGLNQSLDGYVDHLEFAPGPSLFRHFYEQVCDLIGSVYGRRMNAGATSEEVAEALGVAIALNAGAAPAYSARVLEATTCFCTSVMHAC
jgi:hypothetical protein